MRITVPIFAVLLLLSSCSRAGVRGVPVDRIDKKSLQYNTELFRANLESVRPAPNTQTNRVFLEALSNEFASFSLSGETVLARAENLYLSLTNSLPAEKGYLIQRAGICRFKRGDRIGSYKTLLLARSEGAGNSELYYYLGMAQFYGKHDAAGALERLDRVTPAELRVERQDFTVFEASVFAAMNNIPRANERYRTALSQDPSRFYRQYDLMSFYRESGQSQEIPSYVRSALASLEAQKDGRYRVKGFNQVLDMDRTRWTDGLVYDFGLTTGYAYSPNLMYYSRSPQPIDRVKSFFLQTPLKDRRTYRSEKVYYPVFEDYLDSPSYSRILLVESLMDLTNVRHPFSKASATVTKIFGTNTTLMVLSPTNIYLVSTNASVPTNSRDYVITNQSNVILQKTMDFTYYLTTEYVDRDRDGRWEYLLLGFSKTNIVTAVIFDPDTMRFESVKFPVRSGGAKLVIRDMNADGRDDLVLLDDDVVFLKTELLP